MRAPRRLLLLAAVAVLALAAVAVAAGVIGDRRPPEPLVDALEVMPAAAAERGLYYAAQPGIFTSRYGFGPGQVETAVREAYGIRGDDITAVLESGGPASTVLLGRFAVHDVTSGFQGLGYERASRDGWTVLTAGSGAQGPLAAGAEAVALRGDAVVIATSTGLAALAEGGSAASLPWVAPLLTAVPPDATAVAMGPSYDAMVGERTAPPASGAGSPEHAGWMVAFTGEGEQRSGVVSLYFDQPAGPAAAGHLAARIGASSMVGLGADVLVVEAGEPQWDAQRDVATVTITAATSAQGWQQLRRQLEAGEARFLHQR